MTMPDKWATRTKVVTFELPEEAAERLEAKAAPKGLTLEEYVRTIVGLEP